MSLRHRPSVSRCLLGSCRDRPDRDPAFRQLLPANPAAARAIPKSARIATPDDKGCLAGLTSRWTIRDRGRTTMPALSHVHPECVGNGELLLAAEPFTNDSPSTKVIA